MTEEEEELYSSFYGPERREDYETWSFDKDLDGRLGLVGGPDSKITLLKAVCAELSFSGKGAPRRWMRQVRSAGDAYRWKVAFSISYGGEAVGEDLSRIGAALRCLMDHGEDMDETSATILLLRPLQQVWWNGTTTDRHRKVFRDVGGMELFVTAVARAWMGSGGNASMHGMREVIYGPGVL